MQELNPTAYLMSITAKDYVWLFQMALWILTAMQYSDDFNPVRCHTVKQGMAFYGQTSDVW